jgi:hypothetical protein
MTKSKRYGTISETTNSKKVYQKRRKKREKNEEKKTKPYLKLIHFTAMYQGT